MRMRAVLSLSSFLVVLVLTACRTSPTPSAPAHGQCMVGPPTCAVDRGAVVQPIPQVAPTGAAGVPCAAEGSYDCTPDGRAMTVCRGGRTVIASTCRGARGCSAVSAVDCDHSVAMVGDPCDGPREIACSDDAKTLLRCVNGIYQAGESCRNACLSAGSRVLCQ